MNNELKLNAIILAVMVIFLYVFYTSMTVLTTGEFPDGQLMFSMIGFVFLAFGYKLGQIVQKKKQKDEDG